MTLPSLPPEIWTHIASYIRDPCDLKALMKTSRTLCSFIRPTFYSEFPFPDTFYLDSKLYCGLELDHKLSPDYDGYSDYQDEGPFDGSPSDKPAYLEYQYRQRLERHILFVSAFNCWPRLAKAALRRGAPVNETIDANGEAGFECYLEPIVAAASGPGGLDDLEDQLEIVNLLIDSGAEVDAFAADIGEVERGIMCGSALNAAARDGNLRLVELLIGRGADVRGYHPPSPLSFAVANGESEAVKMLIAKGADVVGKWENDPPISLAINQENVEILKLLLEAGADPSTAIGGESILEYAEKHGYDECATVLRSHVTRENNESEDHG